MHVPDERDEALRDLVRARTDAVTDRRDNRHRLKAFLLRHGYKYSGTSSWTEAHLRYLRELVLAHAAHKVVLEEYLLAISQVTERIQRLEAHLATLAASWRMKPVVDALQGLRGVQLLTAVALVAELGDLSRFAHPRQLMAYLGLVSRESSSGSTRRQGSITKAGNSHARWFVVEAAQHYRLAPKVSKELAPRQEKLPARLKEISWNAQVRLHKKYWAMILRGKRVQTVQVAVARELVGFIWATARAVKPVSD